MNTLLVAAALVTQPFHVALDTTTNLINDCLAVHCWSYSNSAYQVPVLPGTAIGGRCRDFVFIGKENTNSTPVDPTVHLLGYVDFQELRVVGVMPWQVTPVYYRTFSLATGLTMERPADLREACGGTNNLVKFTMRIDHEIASETWWVLFFPDECKLRWSIPPIVGTNAPASYLAARFFTGTTWRYYFDTLMRQSGNQTIPYSISMYIPVPPREFPETNVGPLRIEGTYGSVMISWPQTNWSNIWLWSNYGTSMLPLTNKVTVPGTNTSELFWLERR